MEGPPAGDDLDDKGLYKRPGPRLSACQWCGKITCNHCRCTGQMNCFHAPGEMCKNNRYKRRLVCNPCEKNKLKHRQLVQENAEKKRAELNAEQNKKAIASTIKKNINPLSRDGPYSTLYPIQSPNVAIMVYKSQSMLTMISVSSLGGTLLSLRDTINHMMLLSPYVSYVFIKQNTIITLEEESIILAKDIIQPFSFPFPINCCRCFYIHIIQSTSVQPVFSQMPSAYPPAYPQSWSSGSLPAVSGVNSINKLPYDPNLSSIPAISSIPREDTARQSPKEKPSADMGKEKESMDPSRADAFSFSDVYPPSSFSLHLGRESKMWGSAPLPDNALFPSTSNPAAYFIDNNAYLPYREDSASMDFYPGASPFPRSGSYNDMSYVMGNRVSYDYNWVPVGKQNLGLLEERGNGRESLVMDHEVVEKTNGESVKKSGKEEKKE